MGYGCRNRLIVMQYPSPGPLLMIECRGQGIVVGKELHGYRGHFTGHCLDRHAYLLGNGGAADDRQRWVDFDVGTDANVATYHASIHVEHVTDARSGPDGEPDGCVKRGSWASV